MQPGPVPPLSTDMTPIIDPTWVRLADAIRSGRVGLLNARAEFACNSSSSHSIVVLPENVRAGLTESPGYGDYGWSDFTLTSSTEKLRYLAAQVGSDTDLATALRERVGTTGEDWSGDAVDHQSVLTLPRALDGSPDPGYLTALADLLADERVTILGGNDNSGSHPLAGRGTAILGEHLQASHWAVRRDRLDGHEWWVLFSREDGTKARVSLVVEDIVSGWKPDKAPVPELVDIKLTDRCAFEADCGFCYAGSTTKGSQADIVGVEKLLAGLASLGVFEVAFGGGEPTLWRPFANALRFTRSVGIVPNFTSKNYRVLETHPEWLELCGAAAFSVNDLAALDRFAAYVEPLEHKHQRKVGIQCIPELLDDATFERILEWASQNVSRVTLLGYKTTGRGAAFSGRIRRPAGFWLKKTRSHCAWMPVAIDTVLAASSEKALRKAQVPGWSYHTLEGKFSAYVDAVTGRMGPSSFATELDELDLSAGAEEIASSVREGFARY